MDNLVICERQDLVDVANAIREKIDSTDGLTLDAMAAAIEGIEAVVDTSAEDGVISREIAGEYTNDRVEIVGDYAFYNCDYLQTVNFTAATSIGIYAFYSCLNLTTASFPAATVIGSNAFYRCSTLKTVNFPAVTSIGASAFYSCFNLTTASFPAATYIGASAFYSCTSLTTASFPAATVIGSNAFYRCKLASFYLMGSSLCALSGSNAFGSTPIASGTGTIYVPASLLASYKAATNWVYYSSRFSGV